MASNSPLTASEARKQIEQSDHDYVKVGAFDLDGILRGKYMSREKLLSAMDGGGFGFCDVVLGWDSNDKLYDNVTFTGWHTAYPDAPVRLIPETLRTIPFENDMHLMLGEFTDRGEALDPRALLRRVIDRCTKLGFEANAAMEFEFFVFDETPDSIREKKFRDLKPFTPGNFGYSVLRNSVHAELYLELLDLCTSMNFPLEGLHTETGPGVLEAAITVDNALAAADKAALFKTFAKIFFQRRGLMATFMAKWSLSYPGQSGHIHLSLARDGKGIFRDEMGGETMSKTMRYFAGGMLKLMPEVLAMVSPTINSYTRMIPGAWAPTSATWGMDNRTCALRAIAGSEKSQRLEYRIPAADANPYLAIAAALGSGIYGIEHEIEPPPLIRGSAYDNPLHENLALPNTLWQAAQNLKQSEAARDLFGDPFVDHFAATREWEEREYRKQITDWQLERYFEII